MLRFLIKTCNILLIGVVLFGYNHVVQERKTQEAADLAAHEQAQQEADEAAGITGTQYKDGVYSGTAQGFGGDVSVDVTITDGAITNVEVTSAEQEDDAYLEQAMSVTDRIVEAQSADVDVSSGATFSSNGIIGATKAALEQAIQEVDTSAQYKDGVYSGTAQGFGGDVSVDVTITDGAITNVEVTSAEQEDDAYLEQAMSVTDRIVEAQSADVDVSSGATFSSNGIIGATKAALEQAVAE